MGKTSERIALFPLTGLGLNLVIEMPENKFITMRSIAYDTVSIKPGAVVYKLFEDDDSQKDERVNSLLEGELVKFLFTHNLNFYEYLIYEELGIKNTYCPFFERSRPIIDNQNEKPGDIDLLLVDKSQMNKSVAFQVKKLKGFIDIDNINKVKFSNIEEGIVQSNKMFEKFRFYQNYLMLIVANDGMRNTSNNFFFRQVNGSEIKPLYLVQTYESLKVGIGVFIVEITQPTGKDIKKGGKIASKLLVQAAECVQSDSLNNKIELLVNG